MDGPGSGALGDYLSSLITKKLTPAGGKKLRVRADTFGYLQRSFVGFVRGGAFNLYTHPHRIA